MTRSIFLVVVVALAGCTPPPVVVTENPPYYVIVHQSIGLNDSDASVRVGADNEADASCRKHGRNARLPAYDVDCVHRSLVTRICMIYQYTYECVISQD